MAVTGKGLSVWARLNLIGLSSVPVVCEGVSSEARLAWPLESIIYLLYRAVLKKRIIAVGIWMNFYFVLSKFNCLNRLKSEVWCLSL